MKAIKIIGSRKVDVINVAEPKILKPNDVKIKVAYAGICPDEMPFFRRDLNMMTYSSLLIPEGHEMSGYVEDAGEKAKRDGFTYGKRVSGFAWKHCGNCSYCRSGKENLCKYLEVSQSTMAEFIVWSSEQLIEIPDSVSMQEACFTDPIGFSLHGIERADVKIGDRVLIIGGASDGLIMLQLARMRGAKDITILEELENNRNLALRLGADYVSPINFSDFSSYALKITDNNGFDKIFETTGNVEMLNFASKFLAKSGVLAVGRSNGVNIQLPVNITELFIKEASIITYNMAPYKLPLTQKIMEKLELKPLISQIYPIEDAQLAYESSETGQFPHVLVEIFGEQNIN